MKQILKFSLISSLLVYSHAYAFSDSNITATCTEQINNGQQHACHLIIKKTGEMLSSNIFGARFTWKCSDGYIVNGQGFYSALDNRYVAMFENKNRTTQLSSFGVEYLSPTEDKKALIGTVMWTDGTHASESCEL